MLNLFLHFVFISMFDQILSINANYCAIERISQKIFMIFYFMHHDSAIALRFLTVGAAAGFVEKNTILIANVLKFVYVTPLEV